MFGVCPIANFDGTKEVILHASKEKSKENSKKEEIVLVNVPLNERSKHYQLINW